MVNLQYVLFRLWFDCFVCNRTGEASPPSFATTHSLWWWWGSNWCLLGTRLFVSWWWGKGPSCAWSRNMPSACWAPGVSSVFFYLFFSLRNIKTKILMYKQLNIDSGTLHLRWSLLLYGWLAILSVGLMNRLRYFYLFLSSKRCVFACLFVEFCNTHWNCL